MRTRSLHPDPGPGRCGPLVASDPGTTAADFLNLGAGPRAIAMGDAQVGLANDVYSNYWNPAGLATLRTQEAAFVQTQYIQNISQEYLAYALPRTRFGAFGASVNYLSYGTLPGTDAVGQPTGSVGANDMDLGFSYSRDLYLGRALWSRAFSGRDRQMDQGTAGPGERCRVRGRPGASFFTRHQMGGIPERMESGGCAPQRRDRHDL